MHAKLTSSNGVLSPRQQEVVKLIAEDLTAKEIAARLCITEKTVEFHRDHIKQRLSVSGTAGITRYAIRYGIIDP
jgi:DNA-binding CsgD family transcriptional regulator